MTVVERLGGWVASIEYDDLAHEAARSAKERIVDSVGVALYGASQGGLAEIAGRYASRIGGTGEATILGSGARAPREVAALVNGTLVHCMEYDDGHSYAGIHAGAVVVPAALAVGEAMDSSGREVIGSVAAGYAVAYWLARLVNPSHLKRGFHTTGTLGGAAAAAAAAKLMRLSGAGVADAIALAVLGGGGYMETLRSGQAVKGIVAGRAAMLGVQSAGLAQMGASGPRTIIEGQDGFLRAAADGFDRSVLESAPEAAEIMETYSRLWPVCRHAQPALHAAVMVGGLLRERGLAHAACRSVTVDTYAVAARMCSGRAWPEKAEDAKFSMEYLVSAGLVRGGLSAASDLGGSALRDPAVVGVSRCLQVNVDPRLEAEYPEKRVARVTAVLETGEEITACSRDLPGSAAHPLGRDELTEKFAGGAGSILGRVRAASAAALILDSLETLGARGVMEALQPASGGESDARLR